MPWKMDSVMDGTTVVWMTIQPRSILRKSIMPSDM